MHADAIEWLLANGVALVLLVVVLAGWTRAQPHLRRLAVAAAVCVTLAACLLLLLEPSPVPTGWITVLHEGRSIRNVRQLYGQTAHAGAGFHLLLDWLAPGGVTTLPAVVRMNTILALVNIVVFLFIAVYVLDSWWVGLAFAIGYAGNLNTLHAACSETPAMLWTTHFWLGCIAAAVIDARAHATTTLRRLAVLWLALLAILAALLRAELLLIGGPAVAVAVAKEIGLEERIRRAARAAGEVLRAILAGPLPIFLLATAALLVVGFLPWLGHLSYAIEGIAPLNLSFLLLPQKLAVFLPFAFIALFVLGMIHTTRQCLRFFLLPIGFLTLFKVYASATQGVLESFRYLTFLTPMVLFVGLFGFRELSHWAERWAWPPWWRRPAILLLVLSMTAWQPLGPREIFDRRQELPGIASSEPLLGRNQQTEVRYLVDLVGRYPDCVFLVKARLLESISPSDEPPRYRWGRFGARLPYDEMPHDGESPEQAAQRLAPGAVCVLFYRSLDCDLTDSDGCRPEILGRVALEERVLENLPYSDIGSYGAHRAEIHLGVYPVILPSAGTGDAWRDTEHRGAGVPHVGQPPGGAGGPPARTT